MILYFHGFASSPGSAKIGALRARGIELHAPDLNVPSFRHLDFDAIAGFATAEAQRISPRMIAGSSMGALVALAAVKRGVDVPLVLIAPALGVAQRWSENLPDTDPVMVLNHAAGSELPIHRKFFLQMASLHVDDDPPAVPVTVIMGRLDETVPFALVRERWDRWSLGPPSRFIEIPDGDHGLVAHTDLIAGVLR